MACDVPALAEHAPPYVHVDVELRPLARRGPDADRVLARCSCALVQTRHADDDDADGAAVVARCGGSHLNEANAHDEDDEEVAMVLDEEAEGTDEGGSDHEDGLQRLDAIDFVQ